MYRRTVFMLLIAGLCAGGAPAAAQGYYGRDPNVAPLDRILPAVRSAHPGRLYDAEGPFPDANGGYHYRLKWMTPEGRVIWLDTDARSGRVIGEAPGDWRQRGPAFMGGPGGERFGGRPAGRDFGGRDFGGRGFGGRGGGWRRGR